MDDGTRQLETEIEDLKSALDDVEVEQTEPERRTTGTAGHFSRTLRGCCRQSSFVNPKVCRYSAYITRLSLSRSMSRMNCGRGTGPAFLERR